MVGSYFNIKRHQKTPILLSYYELYLLIIRGWLCNKHEQNRLCCLQLSWRHVTPKQDLCDLSPGEKCKSCCAITSNLHSMFKPAIFFVLFGRHSALILCALCPLNRDSLLKPQNGSESHYEIMLFCLLRYSNHIRNEIWLYYQLI